MRPKQGKTRAAAFNHLLTDLREAQRRYVEGDDGGREGAAFALCAVVTFLDAFEEPSDEALATPLVTLSTALLDLGDAVVAPMLKPPKRAGSESEPTTRKVLRAMAVFTLNRLRETGLKRDDAAKRVAEVFNGCGVQTLRGRYRKVTATTVINWRDAISCDFGKGLAAEFLDELTTEIPINPAVRPEDVRADLLKRLRGTLLRYRAADQGIRTPQT